MISESHHYRGKTSRGYYVSMHKMGQRLREHGGVSEHCANCAPGEFRRAKNPDAFIVAMQGRLNRAIPRAVSSGAITQAAADAELEPRYLGNLHGWMREEEDAFSPKGHGKGTRRLKVSEWTPPEWFEEERQPMRINEGSVHSLADARKRKRGTKLKADARRDLARVRRRMPSKTQDLIKGYDAIRKVAQDTGWGGTMQRAQARELYRLFTGMGANDNDEGPETEPNTAAMSRDSFHNALKNIGIDKSMQKVAPIYDAIAAVVAAQAEGRPTVVPSNTKGRGARDMKSPIRLAAGVEDELEDLINEGKKSKSQKARRTRNRLRRDDAARDAGRDVEGGGERSAAAVAAMSKGAAAGTHHNRDRSVARGSSRKMKHKGDHMEAIAQASDLEDFQQLFERRRSAKKATAQDGGGRLPKSGPYQSSARTMNTHDQRQLKKFGGSKSRKLEQPDWTKTRKSNNPNLTLIKNTFTKGPKTLARSSTHSDPHIRMYQVVERLWQWIEDEAKKAGPRTKEAKGKTMAEIMRYAKNSLNVTDPDVINALEVMMKQEAHRDPKGRGITSKLGGEHRSWVYDKKSGRWMGKRKRNKRSPNVEVMRKGEKERMDKHADSMRHKDFAESMTVKDLVRLMEDV